MTLNPYKLRQAIMRGGRAQGVSVHPAFDAEVVRVTSAHVVGLWDRAVKAALSVVPVSVGDHRWRDVNQRDVLRIINHVYRQYSGLTTLNKKLTAAYDRGNSAHKARYLYEMDRALGTDVSALLSDPEAAARVRQGVDDSVRLISTLDADLKARLATDIWTGIANGESRGSLRKLILDRGNVSRYRARLIARDQTAKLYSQLSRVRQEDVGITGYTWRTVGDGAVRPDHDALDGTSQIWASPPSIGHPGDDIQCRCVADPDISTARLF